MVINTNSHVSLNSKQCVLCLCHYFYIIIKLFVLSCCWQRILINHNGDGVHKKLHVSLSQINCFSTLSRELYAGWPRIEDFQLWCHSCVYNTAFAIYTLWWGTVATSYFWHFFGFSSQHKTTGVTVWVVKGHKCSSGHALNNKFPIGKQLMQNETMTIWRKLTVAWMAAWVNHQLYLQN